jgi:hypothetical protein
MNVSTKKLKTLTPKHKGNSMIDDIETVEPKETKPSDLLTSGDLVAIQNLIELASRRGAFAAGESSMIGQIYDKLKAFNEYVAKNAAQATEKKDEVA